MYLLQVNRISLRKRDSQMSRSDAKRAEMLVRAIIIPSVKCSTQLARLVGKSVKFLFGLVMIARYIAETVILSKDNNDVSDLKSLHTKRECSKCICDWEADIMDKKMGRHCGFLNSYIALHVKYEKNGTAIRSCEQSDCRNSKCILSENFMGDRMTGSDFLDYPKK